MKKATPNSNAFEGEDCDGARRQAGDLWYPNFPAMDSELAVRRMEDGECWIRSVHIEFYYCYAVVEECKTGKRFVVKGIGICPAWESPLKFFLNNWS